MNSRPSNDPVIQQLQLLLTGYGYNFYNSVNQARADDLLVRERASYHLAQAVDMLARLRGEYMRRFIPPLTRANPDPPAAWGAIASRPGGGPASAPAGRYWKLRRPIRTPPAHWACRGRPGMRARWRRSVGARNQNIR